MGLASLGCGRAGVVARRDWPCSADNTQREPGVLVLAKPRLALVTVPDPDHSAEMVEQTAPVVDRLVAQVEAVRNLSHRPTGRNEVEAPTTTATRSVCRTIGRFGAGCLVKVAQAYDEQSAVSNCVELAEDDFYPEGQHTERSSSIRLLSDAERSNVV
jgi:hypothetical protein